MPRNGYLDWALTFLMIFLLFAEYPLSTWGSNDHPTLWSQLYGYAQDASVATPALILTSDKGFAFVAINWSRQSTFLRATPPTTVLIKTNSSGGLEWLGSYNVSDGYSLFPTSDGGYVIGGSSLIKVDSNGRIQWSRNYSQATSRLVSVMQTSDEGFTQIWSTEGALSIVKTDSEGNLQWNNTVPINWKGGTAEFIATSDGDYAFIGTVIPGNLTVIYAYSGSVVLTKINPSGDMLWNASFSSHYGSTGLIQTTDGGYVWGDSVGEFAYPTVTKVDRDGNLQWSKMLPTKPLAIKELSDGSLVFAGQPSTRDQHWGPLISVTKTDASGNVQWSQTYGTQSAGYFVNGLTETNDGNLVLSGIWGGWYPLSRDCSWFLTEIRADLPAPPPSTGLPPPPSQPATASTPTATPSDVTFIDTNLAITATVAVAIVALATVAAIVYFRRKRSSSATSAAAPLY